MQDPPTISRIPRPPSSGNSPHMGPASFPRHRATPQRDRRSVDSLSDVQWGDAVGDASPSSVSRPASGQTYTVTPSSAYGDMVAYWATGSDASAASPGRDDAVTPLPPRPASSPSPRRPASRRLFGPQLALDGAVLDGADALWTPSRFAVRSTDVTRREGAGRRTIVTAEADAWPQIVRAAAASARVAQSTDQRLLSAEENAVRRRLERRGTVEAVALKQRCVEALAVAAMQHDAEGCCHQLTATLQLEACMSARMAHTEWRAAAAEHVAFALSSIASAECRARVDIASSEAAERSALVAPAADDRVRAAAATVERMKQSVLSYHCGQRLAMADLEARDRVSAALAEQHARDALWLWAEWSVANATRWRNARSDVLSSELRARVHVKLDAACELLQLSARERHDRFLVDEIDARHAVEADMASSRDACVDANHAALREIVWYHEWDARQGIEAAAHAALVSGITAHLGREGPGRAGLEMMERAGRRAIVVAWRRANGERVVG